MPIHRQPPSIYPWTSPTEEALAEFIFHDLIAKLSRPVAVIFLQIGPNHAAQRPPDDFLTRFRDSPTPIKTIADGYRTLRDGYIDSSTGARGVVVIIEQIQSLTDQSFRVDAGWGRHGLAAAYHRLDVQQVNGQWMIINSRLLRVS